MSCANNYIDKFNVFALFGHVEADKLHLSTVYWGIGLGQTYTCIVYIEKPQQARTNQDNTLGRQEYWELSILKYFVLVAYRLQVIPTKNSY